VNDWTDPNHLTDDELRARALARAARHSESSMNGHSAPISGSNRRPEKAERFPLTPFDQLRPSSAPNYLVKGVFPRVGLIVVWGPPKCGKSFIVSDMMMHVALGWPFRGRRVLQGAVVYCAFEGADGFRARAQAFRERHLQEDAEPVPFFLMPARVDLVADHVALINSLRTQLGTQVPVAVVLDTLNRSIHGSESDDKDMTAYVKAADAIRDAFGCAVIVVHHCGIEGTRPRGHTSLSGAVDAQLAVKRDGAKSIVVTVEYMKDGPEGAEFVSSLEAIEVGVDDDGDPITSCVVEPVETGIVPGEPRKKSLPASARCALDLLRKAVIEAGMAAPQSAHIPPGASVVGKDLWRSYCYAGAISDSDSPEARRKAFGRAAETLLAARVIGLWNDLVWIAE
jgi:hypothetical protein